MGTAEVSTRHVISAQAGRHSPLMALCSYTPTCPPWAAVPPLCSCPCMCRTGPDVKSARCFSEPPARMGCCSPPPVMSPAQTGKSSIRARDGGGGAALHCIRSSSCHPSPGLRESARRNAMQETFTAADHDHDSRPRLRVHAKQAKKQPDGDTLTGTDTDKTRRHGGMADTRGRPSSDCRSGSALRENQPKTSRNVSPQG